jgi:PilZ domain
MRDGRRNARLPSILEGWIAFDLQEPKLQCTLRDISTTGARIWLPGSADLPHEFRLDIPALGQSIAVRLMWSNGRNHGIMFLEELQEQPDDASASAPGDSGSSGDITSLPGVPRNLVPHAEGVLEDARQHLSEILDLPVEKIRLNLEIEP